MNKPIVGHGLSLDHLDALAASGRLKPLGDYCLLEAVWAELADKRAAGIMLNPDGSPRLLLGDAIAFRVRALGPDAAPRPGLTVGALVVNASISGEKLTGNRKGGRFILVRALDICCGADDVDVQAVLEESRQPVAAE